MAALAGHRCWSLRPWWGWLVWFFMRHHKQELQPRHGVILVTLVWVCLPLSAALPMVLSLQPVGQGLSFTYAYFEAVSGLTTAGASVLSQPGYLAGVPEHLAHLLAEWIGGMGILILAVALMPLLGVGASQLFRAEAAGPVKDTKLTPRITGHGQGAVGRVSRCFPSAVSWHFGWVAWPRWMR